VFQSSYFKLFFKLFLVNLFIFGQKIFFYTLTSDDYIRFYLDSDLSFLISDSARWAQVLLNKYIFWDNLQILPYIHGIVGIFSITFMGFITALYFKMNNTFNIAIVTILISVTPMFAQNLAFTTNITAWITMAIALSGFLLLERVNTVWKFIFFICFVIAIGNYQTIIQIALIIIIFNAIIKLLHLQNKSALFSVLKYLIFHTLFVLIALITSNFINNIFLKIYHLHKADRYGAFDNIYNIKFIVNIMKKMYTSSIRFDYFSMQLHILYGILIFVALFTILYAVINQKIRISFKIKIVSIIALLVFAIPIIINLPLIVENWISVRSHFAIDWVLAGSYILIIFFAKEIIRIFIYFVVFSIIAVSIYYINVFFDAQIRQTNADILRSNLMVERIRMHPNYIREPLKLKIVGVKQFNVVGFKQKFNQAFSLETSKYKIFKNFTDMQFTLMNHQEWEEMKDYLIKKGEKIYAYPGKNSIIVNQEKAVIFFDTNRINMQIDSRKYLKQFSNKNPIKKAFFDIFLNKNILYYYRNACKMQDIKNQFFLRLYKKKKDGSINENIPTTNLDFYFNDHGIKTKNQCTIAVHLPAYNNIGRIYTGQFIKGKKIIWEEKFTPKN